MAPQANGPASASTRPPAPSGRRTGPHGLLEALRAPLLLTPAGDVLAGWSLTLAAVLPTPSGLLGGVGWPAAGLLAAAMACGTALLAAGMAANALVDLPEDERRKPERPLPRGAVSAATVRSTFVALSAGALLVAAGAPVLLPSALLIVLGTAAYHGGLKRHRLGGCLTLGTLRALDMSLGVAAARGALADAMDAPAGGGWPWIACCLYGAYVCGASLHASTDDEAGGEAWSRRGLGLALAAVGAACLLAAGRVGRHPGAAALAGLLVLLLAGIRLAHARSTRAPPAVTGVALSNLLLLAAGACLVAGQPVAGLLCLLLFAASRRLLKHFPPS